MMVASLQHQGREVFHHHPGGVGEEGVGEVCSQPVGRILLTNQPSLHLMAKELEVRNSMVHTIAHILREQESVMCAAT